MSLINCPSCGSEDCQRYSVLHAHGTSTVNTTSSGLGVGVSRGGIGIGVGRGRTTGTQQTHVGAMTAPPARKRLKRSAITCAVLVFFALAAFSEGSGVGGGIFLLVLAAIPAYFVYRAFSYNNGAWRGLLAQWEQTWFCNKCGDSFRFTDTVSHQEVAAALTE